VRGQPGQRVRSPERAFPRAELESRPYQLLRMPTCTRDAMQFHASMSDQPQHVDTLKGVTLPACATEADGEEHTLGRCGQRCFCQARLSRKSGASRTRRSVMGRRRSEWRTPREWEGTSIRGPNQRLVSHGSEAVRLTGHLCDSLRRKQQRAGRCPSSPSATADGITVVVATSPTWRRVSLGALADLHRDRCI
jgi:hypothetical protein